MSTVVEQHRNVKKVRSHEGDWKEVRIPRSVKVVVLLNLQSYAGGRDLWGLKDLSKDAKKGWHRPIFNDGLIEVVGLRNGWHTALVMGGASRKLHAKRLAQAREVEIELRARGSQVKGESSMTYMQLDGEPWPQPVPPEEADPLVVHISHAGESKMLLNNERLRGIPDKITALARRESVVSAETSQAPHKPPPVIPATHINGAESEEVELSAVSLGPEGSGSGGSGSGEGGAPRRSSGSPRKKLANRPGSAGMYSLPPVPRFLPPKGPSRLSKASQKSPSRRPPLGTPPGDAASTSRAPAAVPAAAPAAVSAEGTQQQQQQQQPELQQLPELAAAAGKGKQSQPEPAAGEGQERPHSAPATAVHVNGAPSRRATGDDTGTASAAAAPADTLQAGGTAAAADVPQISSTAAAAADAPQARGTGPLAHPLEGMAASPGGQSSSVPERVGQGEPPGGSSGPPGELQQENLLLQRQHEPAGTSSSSGAPAELQQTNPLLERKHSDDDALIARLATGKERTPGFSPFSLHSHDEEVE